MWGRRRRTEGQLWAAAHEELMDATELAGRTYARLDQETARFEDALEEIRSLLGRGNGLPVNTVRAQLAAGQQAIAPCREARTGYDEARALWRHPETEDAAALAEAAGHFRDLTELGSELLESLTETIDVMAGLRDKLAELPGKIAPIRERVQASLAAARTELAWAGGSAAQGRYALEARLHAAEDRLRELDAGRVEVTPGRKFTDLYRDVEVQVAEVRDALARASS